MRKTIELLLIICVLYACEQESKQHNIKQVSWKSKELTDKDFSNYYRGKTYLPVYSHIYHVHEHRTFDLTTTISIRNVSLSDTVYIFKADYFNTVGENIRQYIKHPIYVSPLETIEIVIDEEDEEGGSGANFVFEWAMENDKNPPLYEAVMISTYGQQGLSFTTRGVPINE
ncbi:DUF3124 domain-containing protein [Saccharicrinis fermentans]|nr:DUF3124 domain-containing protein [Saccharicrinis fermentans]